MGKTLDKALGTGTAAMDFMFASGGNNSDLTGPIIVPFDFFPTSQGITYLSGQFTLPTTGIYEVEYTGVTGSTIGSSTDVYIGHNRTVIPVTADPTSFICRGFTNSSNTFINAGISCAGVVNVVAGDTISFWLNTGSLFLSSAGSSGRLNNLSIIRVA